MVVDNGCPYVRCRPNSVECQRGEIQPIHCKKEGIEVRGKNVPENINSGIMTKRPNTVKKIFSSSSFAAKELRAKHVRIQVHQRPT